MIIMNYKKFVKITFTGFLIIVNNLRNISYELESIKNEKIVVENLRSTHKVYLYNINNYLCIGVNINRYKNKPINNYTIEINNNDGYIL